METSSPLRKPGHARVLRTAPALVLCYEEFDHTWDMHFLWGLTLYGASRGISDSGLRLRGIAIERLERVLATGIDRDEPHDPIYATTLERPDYAMASAATRPRLFTLYDQGKLERTWTSYPLSTPETEVRSACSAAGYVTVKQRLPQGWWCSRFSSWGEAGSSGEELYGFWSRGAPMAALLAVVVVGSDLRAAADRLTAPLAAARSAWTISATDATEIEALFI